MKNQILIVVGLALTLSAPTLTAQKAQAGRGRGPGPAVQAPQGQVQQAQLPPFFQLLDVNQDGALDVDEVAKVPSFLASLDKNKDMQIAAAEFCPNQAAGTGPRCAAATGMLPPCLSLFDKDQDGTLSKAEINGAGNVLAALDKNNDLKLTANELCQGRGFGGGRGAGMGMGMGMGMGGRGFGARKGFCGGGNPNCPLQSSAQ